MRIYFIEDKSKDYVYFMHHDRVPELRAKATPKSKINLTLLEMYILYRDAIFNSYSEKDNVALDIQSRTFQFENDKNDFKMQRLSDIDKHIYHYSVLAALDAMQEWKVDGMQSYIAYKDCDGLQNKVGFVHFIEKTYANDPNKKYVYIAQAGVLLQGASIGRRLMECVIAQYPAGTDFLIGTRIFNTEAKTLYQDRLNFTPMSTEDIKKLLDLDERYCGFKLISNQEQIDLLKKKQSIFYDIDTATYLPSICKSMKLDNDNLFNTQEAVSSTSGSAGTVNKFVGP